MTAFNNMKISGKISLLVGFFLLVQLLTTSFGILKMWGIHEELEEIVKQNLPINKMLSDVTIHQLRQVYLFNQMLHDGERVKTNKNALNDFQKTKKEYDALAETITAQIEASKMLVKTEERKREVRDSSLKLLEILDHIEKIQQENFQYQSSSESLLALIVLGKATEDEIGAQKKEAGQLSHKLKVLLLEVEKFSQESAETATRHEADAVTGMWGLALMGAIISILLAIFFVRLISRPLMLLSHAMKEVVAGDYSKRVDVKSQDEVGTLGSSFNTMIASTQKMMEDITHQSWLQSNLSMVSDIVQKAKDPKHLSQSLIGKLAPLLESGHAAVYIKNETTERYELLASYGFVERTNMINSYGEGERLVGQCVRENQAILLSRVPDDYILIGSGLGEAKPQQIIVIPVTYKESVLAVVELASFHTFSPIQQQLLQALIPIIGLGLENQQQSHRTQRLLEETQRQAEELRTQQEELQVQQEELNASNETLRKQAEALIKNKAELEASQDEIEDKVAHLEQVSRYKSEFLANMSHELRTPLNSLLILTKMFAENNEGNLTEKQVEAGGVIHASGQELLELINNILDLAKVESGKQTMELKPLETKNLAKRVRLGFSHIAADKGLELEVTIDANAPNHLISDEEIVWQILKNFLSNAFKFTEKGRVAVIFSANISDQAPASNALRLVANTGIAKILAISVADSGIGIAAAKREMIFEAFQQANGSTSRKYGGTGLGLSICQKLAILLNGEIRLQSQEGEGSTFTLLLPDPPDTTGAKARLVSPSDSPWQDSGGEHSPRQENRRQTDTGFQEDDRTSIGPNDQVILVMANNPDLCNTIADLSHKKNYKYLWASRGETGLKLVERFQPSGIFVDASLGDMENVAVLHHLKESARSRHIPVCLFTPKEQTIVARQKGAVATLSPPISEEQWLQVFERFQHFEVHNIRKVLVAGKNPKTQTDLVDLLSDGKIHVSIAANGHEAQKSLSGQNFDCLVLEPDLADMSGIDLVAWLNTQAKTIPLPVILYADRSLNEEEQRIIEKQPSRVIHKGASAEKHLVHEVAMYLHSMEPPLPESQQAMVKKTRHSLAVLKGHTVLIVDDDVRNLYALAAALEMKEITVIQAGNGEIALQQMEKHPEVALILMDIMMPVMDGFAAIEMVRKQEQYKNIPIIVLTAKAMLKDREKCLAAGASDFISKPVDMDRLVSLMQIWLNK